jgi:hypothetical protein
MTAEAAIMNTQGIALAADRLFVLSKYCPVGIMMYPSASIMGIEWESIIKPTGISWAKNLLTRCKNMPEILSITFQSFLTLRMNKRKPNDEFIMEVLPLEYNRIIKQRKTRVDESIEIINNKFDQELKKMKAKRKSERV